MFDILFDSDLFDVFLSIMLILSIWLGYLRIKSHLAKQGSTKSGTFKALTDDHSTEPPRTAFADPMDSHDTAGGNFSLANSLDMRFTSDD